MNWVEVLEKLILGRRHLEERCLFSFGVIRLGLRLE